jgi:DNA-binding Lrp family transcriptional regulator
MLDLKDKKILYELCTNSRLPSTVISKKVGLSREVVDYRIRRLEREGIIEKTFASIDVEAFGYKPYIIFLLVQNFTEKKQEEILSYLKAHPSIRWMATVFGKYDIVMRVSSSSQEQLESIMNEISSFLGDNLQSMQVISGVRKLKSVNIRDIFYKSNNQQIEQKEKKADSNIDVTDVKILKKLSEESRTSLVEIGSKLHLTPEAVKYRVRRLENSGIIKGYSCAIGLSKMNLSWYILLFSLKNMSAQEEKSMTTLLNMNKKVLFANKCLGAWNFYMEILAENTEDFHNTLLEMRNKLGKNLNSFELLLVSKEHLNVMFPKMIEDDLLKKLPAKKEN